jgi:hypothetical protein
MGQSAHKQMSLRIVMLRRPVILAISEADAFQRGR